MDDNEVRNRTNQDWLLNTNLETIIRRERGVTNAAIAVVLLSASSFAVSLGFVTNVGANLAGLAVSTQVGAPVATGLLLSAWISFWYFQQSSRYIARNFQAIEFLISDGHDRSTLLMASSLYGLGDKEPEKALKKEQDRLELTRHVLVWCLRISLVLAFCSLIFSLIK